MISPSEAEEGVVKHLISGAKKLGYKPFNNITYVSENANGEGKLTGVCPLCGERKTFESLDEIDLVKEVEKKALQVNQLVHLTNCYINVQLKFLTKSLIRHLSLQKQICLLIRMNLLLSNQMLKTVKSIKLNLR